MHDLVVGGVPACEWWRLTKGMLTCYCMEDYFLEQGVVDIDDLLLLMERGQGYYLEEGVVEADGGILLHG